MKVAIQEDRVVIKVDGMLAVMVLRQLSTRVRRSCCSLIGPWSYCIWRIVCSSGHSISGRLSSFGEDDEEVYQTAAWI